MAYQSKEKLKAKIQTLIDKAQSILELGEGVRHYNHRKYVTFNVKISLKSIEDILATLPIPTVLCNKFEAEHKWVEDSFLQDQRDAVKEWFEVDHEAAKTNDFQKAKKSALWNVDTNNVGFYGEGGGHFAFFEAKRMEEIINDCENELRYSTKRDELVYFIERGDFESFNSKCDDIIWVYENFVKDMTSSIKEDWINEVKHYVDQFDFTLDEDETREVVNDIAECVEFAHTKIELLTTTRDGVDFIVFLTDNHKLLNRDSYVGLYKNERKNSVTWLDSFENSEDGENSTEKSHVNFLNNRAKMLDEMLRTWRHEEWLR